MKLTLFDAVQKWKGVQDLQEFVTSDPTVEDDELSWVTEDGAKYAIQYSIDNPAEFNLQKNSEYVGKPVYISRPTPSEFRRVYKTLEQRFYDSR